MATRRADRIEEAIRQEAPEIAKRIGEAAEAHPGDEANFRRVVERLIEDFASTPSALS